MKTFIYSINLLMHWSLETGQSKTRHSLLPNKYPPGKSKYVIYPGRF